MYMARDRSKGVEISKSFRNALKQSGVYYDLASKGSKREETPVKERAYFAFKKKYVDFENHIDSFTPTDFTYYFLEKSKENDVGYVVMNWGKEVGIFKKLMKVRENLEIALMIDFLFSSNQSYITRSYLAPSILVSGWGNKIYQDSLLWVDDLFVDVPIRKKGVITGNSIQEEVNSNVSIGEW